MEIKHKNMKIHLAIFCVLSCVQFATATVQTTVDQDKPALLYVKSYTEGLGAVDITIDGIYISVESLGEGMNYQDGVIASGYSQWKFSGALFEAGSGDSVGSGDFFQQFIVTKPQCCTSPGGTLNGVNEISGQLTYKNLINGFPGYPWNLGLNNNLTVTNAGTDTNYNCHVNFESSDISMNSSGSSGGTQYSRTSKTQIKLKTGGKSTSKLRNVFRLNISASDIDVGTTEASWRGDVLMGTPIETESPFSSFSAPDGWKAASIFGNTNLPPSGISVGTYGNATAINSAGYAQKDLVLPDNSDIDVTPVVLGSANYSFNMSFAGKYHSYYDVFVEQPSHGYSFQSVTADYEAGHAFWQFRTEIPSDALQFISTNLTQFLGKPWGFYPASLGNLANGPGFLQNDGPPTAHAYNIKRTFYVGFPELVNGLKFTQSMSNSPPDWSIFVYACVDAACDAAFEADIPLSALPRDRSPQNFGVSLIVQYPAPGTNIGPFIDNDNVYYPAPLY